MITITVQRDGAHKSRNFGRMGKLSRLHFRYAVVKAAITPMTKAQTIFRVGDPYSAVGKSGTRMIEFLACR